MRWSRDGVQIVGARTDTLTISAETIDITDKADAGWRTLLDDVALRTVSASIAGVVKDATWQAISVGTASALMEECDLLIDGKYTLLGDFMLTNVTFDAPQGDALTFTATMEGSGTFTTTSGPYVVTPGVVTGTTTVGQVLSYAADTWAGTPTITFSRPWQKSLNGIAWVAAGALGGTYTIVADDVGYYFRKLTTATNGVGSATSSSNIVGPVTA